MQYGRALSEIQYQNFLCNFQDAHHRTPQPHQRRGQHLLPRRLPRRGVQRVRHRGNNVSKLQFLDQMNIIIWQFE